MQNFLHTQKTEIAASNNRPIHLRGVNLGGWLMMEAYILHTPNFPEKSFRKNFAKVLGEQALAQFDEAFRVNFITEKDIQKIARLGFNCLRIPFHYRVVESKPFEFKASGLKYLDRVVSWAKKNKIWIILDLHAAPGSQNHDWHSDSSGKTDFWHTQSYQERAIALWEFLADRYRNEEFVAGFDLLNEAVLSDSQKLNHWYKRVIRKIRAVNRNQILFVEGNRWAQDLEILEDIEDDNYVLSIHAYEPIDFTAHFVPHLSYPLNGQRSWNKAASRQLLYKYHQIAQKCQVPLYVGEFGVNNRQGFSGEHLWVRDMLSCFKEFGFHWTYWTYKAVKNHIFPDGIFSYCGNPLWVNWAGPRTGWETFSLHWPQRKKEMIASWHTDQFKENPFILKALGDALR